ncbi:MAG TPA: MFS transporter [Burkholderiales bacterium]|nr:MFS transporter [Burkholderiales bacterium]
MTGVTPAPARRLIGFGLGIAAYLIGLFHRAAPATIAADLAQSFETSAAALGVLAATYYWVYTAMQIPSGILADTLGPRRLLAGGGLIAAAGAALFALAPGFGVAATGRLLVALGGSVAFVACLKLIASWYDARIFATLTGVVVLVGNLSSAAAGGPFAWLLQSFGWREVILALAAASLVVAIASWVLVDDLLRARSVGLEAGWRKGLGGVLANPATWPIFLANFGAGGSFLSFATLWAVPYLVDVHGMARPAAANHVTVVLGVFAVGGLVIGTLSDRMRRRKPLYAGGAGLLFLAWTPLVAGWPLGGAENYVLFGVMGVATGGMTLSWACCKEVNAPQYAGIATGVANMAIFLGPAVMQPVIGWVLDVSQSDGVRAAATHDPDEWHRALIVLAALALFGFTAALFVRETRARNVFRPPAAR